MATIYEIEKERILPKSFPELPIALTAKPKNCPPKKELQTICPVNIDSLSITY